jgi:fatty acid desaturase
MVPAAQPARWKFFRYSAWDSLVVLGGLGQFALVVGSLIYFPVLPVWALVLIGFVQAWSICWNLQSVSHNFIHNPFFAWEPLNRLWGVIETIELGVPHMIYHHFHMNHHFGDNDKIGPNGTTKDWSSTYRYGKNGQPESFVSYVLVSFFRTELTPAWVVIKKHGPRHVHQLIIESVALAGFLVAALCLHWQYVVFLYLPAFYCGWVLSYAEGYVEHHDTIPGNPLANAVSSYHWLYNLTWFNNGYHQEHHWDPKCHWTKIPKLSDELRPKLIENGTRMIKGPHMLIFLEDWWNGRKPRNAMPATQSVEAKPEDRQAA